jgi:hypothetical protein
MRDVLSDRVVDDILFGNALRLLKLPAYDSAMIRKEDDDEEKQGR